MIPGSQVIIAGINVMTSNAATSTHRYGMIRLLILPILVLAIPEATNRFTAIGGVIIPMEVLIIMMIPNAIGDNPRDTAMGSKMGVTSRIMDCVSRKHPRNSKITLIISSNATLLVNSPRTLDAIKAGIFWFEADLMLDMGFIEQVRTILSLVPENCRISLFSATLKPEIRELADEFIPHITYVLQEPTDEQTAAIAEKVYFTDQENKYDAFLHVLMDENPQSCMIFCGTREMTNVLFQKMRRRRIFCGMLHGEMEQRERLKTVDAFRRGCFRFLIATDVAARGVDFEQITHVVNYDFPTGKETYVHRIGRTGRNGKCGTAVSLVTEEDKKMLKQVEEFVGQNLPCMELPVPDEEKEKVFWKSQRIKTEAKPQKGAALNEGITRLSIGGGRKSKMRAGDIVGAVCSLDGVEASDIGIVDIRDSLSYVEVLNFKGEQVIKCLQAKPIKGKIRKVRKTKRLRD